MVSFPNAKINLGLNIVRRRSDGYHDLETAFYPTGWRDVLEVTPLAESDGPVEEVRLTLSGIVPEGAPSDNLCVKAWRILRREVPGLPPVAMHLHKTIPTGAGLGGGSSDGVAALRMLDEMYGLSLPTEQLESLALELGSDCPFFVRNRPCFAQGRGERMQELSLDLGGYSLLLVHPGIHVSTARAFAGVQPKVPELSIPDILQEPVENWRGRLVNDFEVSVFASYPAIAGIRDALYTLGAVYASMSGSGSSVYGIFQKGGLPKDTGQFPAGYAIFRQESLHP